MTVGTYWVIFKFRMRTDADNPNTADELFDVNLDNLPTGEMTLRLFDHRSGGDIPLDVASPVVPVGGWFQVEGFYRNTQDQAAASPSGWTAARSSTCTGRWPPRLGRLGRQQRRARFHPGQRHHPHR